jgi:hypothetical protein
VPAHKAYDKPSTVTPVDGEVTVDGPDGVGLSMTPDAAHQTGERLRDAAAEARGQPLRENAVEDDDG